MKTRNVLEVGLLVLVGSCTNVSSYGDADVYDWGESTFEAALSQADQIAPKLSEYARMPEDIDLEGRVEPGPVSGESTQIDASNLDFVRDVGVVSALARHCALPWEDRNFLPMMQWQRSRLPAEEQRGHRIGKIGFAHGFAMGRTDHLLFTWQPDCKQLASDLEGRMFADVFPGFES